MEHSFTHSDQKFLFNSSTLRDLKHFGSPKNEYLLKSLILLDKSKSRIIKRVLLKMLSNDEGFPTFSKMKFYV